MKILKKAAGAFRPAERGLKALSKRAGGLKILKDSNRSKIKTAVKLLTTDHSRWSQIKGQGIFQLSYELLRVKHIPCPYFQNPTKYINFQMKISTNNKNERKL